VHILKEHTFFLSQLQAEIMMPITLTTSYSSNAVSGGGGGGGGEWRRRRRRRKAAALADSTGL
jgi:hypothetical protein